MDEILDKLLFELSWRESVSYLRYLRKIFQKELKRRTKEKLDALDLRRVNKTLD